MEDIEKQFIVYVEKVNNNKNQNVSNEIKLKLYGMFKQATVGDINIPKPSSLNIVETYKWNAWNECIGLNKKTAMKMYIKCVKENE